MVRNLVRVRETPEPEDEPEVLRKQGSFSNLGCHQRICTLINHEAIFMNISNNLYKSNYLTNFKFSKHAKIRMQQRGILQKDIDLIINYGEMVGESHILTKQAIGVWKNADITNIQSLERLKKIAVIEKNGVIITTFHTNKFRINRMRKCGFRSAIIQ